MATLKSLELEGKLVKMGGNLLPHECAMRTMYSVPSVITWIKTTLPGLTSDGFVPDAVSPFEQAVEQVHAFVRGDGIEGWMQPRLLQPHDKAVWELRTADLRFFGWFYRRGVFILTAIDTKLRCREHDLYSGYLNQCGAIRDRLNLDKPDIVRGGISDVF